MLRVDHKNRNFIDLPDKGLGFPFVWFQTVAMVPSVSDLSVGNDNDDGWSNYVSLLRPYIARHAPDDQVDDLLQETILRIHQRGAPDAIDNFRAYAFQTARSVIIDGGRRDAVRKRDAHFVLEEYHYPIDPITPEQTLMDRESVQEFVAALQEMPERTRDIFVLQRFEDMSYPAIAQYMGISLSAVGKHMVKALRLLAERDFL